LATSTLVATNLAEVAPALRRIRALVVHQRTEVRSSISAMLDRTDRVDVIAEAKDGIVGMRAALSHAPDLIVADLDTATICHSARGDSALKRRLATATMIVICGPNEIHLAETAKTYGAEIYVLHDGFSPEFEARVARLVRLEHIQVCG